MRLKLKDFRSVNFHDCKLLKIEESPGYIRMQIGSGLITLPLNEQVSKVRTIYECSLECFGVTVSEKKEWDDSRQKQWDDACLVKPSSDANLPFEDIVGGEVEDSFLRFEGFTRDKKFAAWRITAQYFELNWRAQKEFVG